jgi:hypothetical protein
MPIKVACPLVATFVIACVMASAQSHETVTLPDSLGHQVISHSSTFHLAPRIRSERGTPFARAIAKDFDSGHSFPHGLLNCVRRLAIEIPMR